MRYPFLHAPPHTFFFGTVTVWMLAHLGSYSLLSFLFSFSLFSYLIDSLKDFLAFIF